MSAARTLAPGETRPAGRSPGLRRLLASRGTVVAVLLFAFTAVLAIASPWIAPMAPEAVQLPLRNEPPGTLSLEGVRHLLGTDFLGRDVFTRMLFGLRISLIVGFSAIALGTLIGVSLGIWAGYFGGAADAVIMRLVDIQLSFPAILLAIAWVAFIGPSLVSLVVIIALTSWVEYARVTRGATLSLREQTFIEGGRAIGMSNLRILTRYVFPNVVSHVIIVATLQLGRAIILESTLSFLGLGIQPPTPSLGNMLAEGRRYLDTAWWVATMPGLAIMFLVLGANLLGDSLRDVLDPRYAKE